MENIIITFGKKIEEQKSYAIKTFFLSMKKWLTCTHEVYMQVHLVSDNYDGKLKSVQLGKTVINF